MAQWYNTFSDRLRLSVPYIDHKNYEKEGNQEEEREERDGEIEQEEEEEEMEAKVKEK